MCSLCKPEDEKLIFSNSLFRVILVDDEFYPGFVRLILTKHIKEMSDLAQTQANSIFTALLAIERCLKYIFSPDKINLASLGNFVPHLHWHIIPRYINDRHFPNPIWGNVTNENYTPPKELLILQDKLVTLLQQELI